MSAFFIWLEFSERAIEPKVARSMLDDIESYGGDHRQLLLNDQLAIGVHSRWTTPEDVGEQQPILNHSETEYLLFDGRIDNRDHLMAELSLKTEVGSDISDAKLLHTFLSRYGEARLAEVLGPFVFVLFDRSKGTVLCARDAMGGRYLVYRQSPDRLIIASTELAFLSHPDVGHQLNQNKVALWLINQQEGQHSSCLQGLTPLNPGQLIDWADLLSAGAERTFYRPNPERRITLASNTEYATEFRRLLDQAVRRRLRSRAKVGSMLSGGMDSVPITISAAKEGNVDSLVAYSWVFDDSPEMDERQYSEPVCRDLGLRQELIKCDELWPQFDKDTHHSPIFPFALPYSEFQQQTFRQAQRDGVSVMLSGLQGDLLYETAGQQVIDQIKQLRLRDAFKEFSHQKKVRELSAFTGFKRYLLAPLTMMQPLLEKRRQSRPVKSGYLVDELLCQLSSKPHWLFDTSLKAARPLQYRIVLDGFAGEDAMLGRVMENKYQIERRYPFRDRDLCEFLLAIPTEQLEKLGGTRPIVKRAYKSEFSAGLLSRNDKTDFSERLFDGISKDRKWRSFLEQQPSFWQKYVKECDVLHENLSERQYLVVMWQCAYYNFWHQIWYDRQTVSIESNDGRKVKRQN